jgi:hypothetical protein
MQSGANQNLSPITPFALVPFSDVPGLMIDPSVKLTNLLHGPPVWSHVRSGFSGSRLGTINGFTQRGWTGVTVPKGPPLEVRSEAEGLKASAVAVALMLFPGFPQMREKKVGRLARETSTVTIGFTPNAPVGGKFEQSAAPGPAPAEYSTLGTVTDVPPTALWVATATAAWVAGLVDPPQLLTTKVVPGSPVKPDIKSAGSGQRSNIGRRCASRRVGV